MVNDKEKVLKILIVISGLTLYLLSILIPSSWYCGELIGMVDLKSIIFSFCFINYLIYSMLIVGLLVLLNLSKLTNKYITFLLIIIILIAIIFQFINSGTYMFKLNIQFAVMIQILKSYIGSFLGIFVGIYYFKIIRNTKWGLFYLLFIWLAVNILYPSINW